MKTKKLLCLGSAFILSFGSLLAINFGTVLAAGNNCTWTGAGDGTNFSDAANWSNCGSVAPGAGDNLVFDNTNWSNNQTLNNDMTGLSVGSVMLSGNNGISLTLTGNPLSIAGGISITSPSFPILEFDMALTLSADQAISGVDGSQQIKFGNFSNPSTLTIGASNITISSATATINDAISGSGGITVSTPTTFSGDNSGYSGNITINSGGEILAVSSSPLGSGAVAVNSGASLYFALPGDTTVANNITLSGTGLDQSTGTLQNADFIRFGPGNGSANGGKLTLSGTVTLNSDAVYSGDLVTKITGTYNANGHKISVMAGQAGTITTPSGTASAPAQTITIATSDKSSDFVDIGTNQTYIIDGQRGSVSVRNGGILKGTGTVSDLSVFNGGIVAPGHSPGCLNSGNLTLQGTYQAEIGGNIACTGYDQMNVTGTVDVTGGTLSVSLYDNYKPKAGETYTIIKNDGSDKVTGTFKNLKEGATFKVSGYVLKITYKGGTGNDVVLSVVSVPSTPDTGFAPLSSHPGTTLLAATLAAGTILGIARRTRKLSTRR